MQPMGVDRAAELAARGGPMNTIRTLTLKVHFEDRAEAASCLQGLRRIPGASVNVVRGRVTSSEANYDLEISGPGKELDQVIRNLAQMGIPNVSGK